MPSGIKEYFTKIYRLAPLIIATNSARALHKYPTQSGVNVGAQGIISLESESTW